MDSQRKIVKTEDIDGVIKIWTDDGSTWTLPKGYTVEDFARGMQMSYLAQMGDSEAIAYQCGDPRAHEED